MRAGSRTAFSVVIPAHNEESLYVVWYLIRNRKLTKQIFTGRDRAAADSFYYETR